MEDLIQEYFAVSSETLLLAGPVSMELVGMSEEVSQKLTSVQVDVWAKYKGDLVSWISENVPEEILVKWLGNLKETNELLRAGDVVGIQELAIKTIEESSAEEMELSMQFLAHPAMRSMLQDVGDAVFNMMTDSEETIH